MAPKGLYAGSADDLEIQYGGVVREYGEVSPYRLRVALAGRQPSIAVTEGVLKVWIAKYRMAPNAIVVSGSEELEKKYGDAIRHLAAENRTGYKVMAALKQRTPPVYVTRQAATDWLRKYGTAEPVRQINSAGHLEEYVGQRIRDDESAKTFNAEALSNWVYTSASISASVRVCQTWLSKEWSSSGKLLDAVSVEETLGDRLRLDEYKHRFADDAVANRMAEDLAEGQPPVSVNALTLRQWYVRLPILELFSSRSMPDYKFAEDNFKHVLGYGPWGTPRGARGPHIVCEEGPP